MRLALLFALLVLWNPISARALPKEEYRLGPDDVVQVQVYGRADLSGQAALDPDGNLRLPLLGTVAAANRTTAELGRELSQRYSIIDSRVSEVLVSVTEYNNQRVTVVGEVRTPGRFGFPVLPNLWELILTAGGATTSADLSRVQIVRKQHDSGEPPVVTIDLSAGVEKIEPDSLPRLRPQDTVIVPSAVVAGTAAPGGDTYQVLGSVRSPGSYRLSTAKTIVEALAVCGGPLPDADLSSVHLTRTTSKGVVAYEIDMKKHLEQGKPVVDLRLEPGDAILVPSGGSAGSWILDTASRLLPLVTLITSIAVLKHY
jgi:polysaccharide biosynthesis/export protein